MTSQGEEESYEPLVEQRLGRMGVEVKLDKGFEQGVYTVYIEYDQLAERVGFSAARRQALDYAARLRGQLARTKGYALGGVEDASHRGDPRRKRDLECTFLSFPVSPDDGRWHDATIKERFRLALLRADQEWDQTRARQEERRREGRRETFRQRLGMLLESAAYGHVDKATKERLVAEVTALAFPARENDR